MHGCIWVVNVLRWLMHVGVGGMLTGVYGRKFAFVDDCGRKWLLVEPVGFVWALVRVGEWLLVGVDEHRRRYNVKK